MKELHLIFGAESVPGLLSEMTRRFSEFPDFKCVFKRYFLSDISQMAFFPPEEGAVAFVVQPPLGAHNVAVWIYLAGDVEKIEYSEGVTRVLDCCMEHIWTSSSISNGPDSFSQTSGILESFEAFLENENMDIASNCIRTWFFCKDIDHNYSGLVRARREIFRESGLTPQTHFIASTGIEGGPVSENALVQMDTYSVRGILPLRFLYAPEYLNPTYEYGVTFERGVRIDYSGYGHCLISGTASIDNKGSVLHKGDVVAQTFRMWENVEALLNEGGMTWEDVRMALVYVRNDFDYQKIASLFTQKFKDVPFVILKAPVCRPEWLVEMECIAISES